MATSATHNDPDGFRPTCVDCGYDLDGIPDGRCPECGFRFSRAALARRFVQEREAAQDRSASRRKNLRLFAAMVLIYIFLGVAGVLGSYVPFESVWVFAGLLTLTVLSAVVYGVWIDPAWRARSHRILVFLVPVIIFSGMYSAVPYRSTALLLLGLFAIVIAVLALRNSPLISAFLLALCVALPLLLSSGILAVHARRLQLRGLRWTEWNVPTPHGWAALKTSDATAAAMWLFVAGTVVSVLGALYARRAFFRLRRVHREFASLREWLEQAI